jgi:hypothetical protein
MFFNTPPTQLSLPYSYGIDRAILKVVSQIPENVTVNLDPIVAEAFCLVHPAAKVNKELPKLVNKVNERIHKLKAQIEEAGKAPPPIQVKTMGTSFAEWVGSLDTETSCLYLADNDPGKAYSYYWYAEMEHVEAALKQKIAQASQELIGAMEAAMYGFGGKYSDDDSGSQHFDLSAGQGLSELKQMGF